MDKLIEEREPNSIEIFNILIEEPMRSSTDVLVGLTSLILCYILFSKSLPQVKESKFFLGYFFFMGLATVCAGTFGHAFQYIFGYNWKALGWSFSALSIFMLQQASFRHLKNILHPNISRTLIIFSYVQIIVFFILILYPGTRYFIVVQSNSALGLMGTILPVHLYAATKHKVKSSQWYSFAFLWGLLPAVVYNFELGIHQWFDHSAVAHILIIIFLFIMYNGTKKLEQINAQ